MYCSKQDLIDRFSEAELVELTDRDFSGAISEQVLNQAIADASAEIEGYLSARFQFPLTSIPPVLNTLACNMTRYFLYDDSASEIVTKRYNDAVIYLKDVRDGKTSLGVAIDGTKAQSIDLAEMQSDGSVFNRKVSKGFI